MTKFINRFVRWHKKKYSQVQRFLFLFVQFLFFVIVFPLLISSFSQRIDMFFSFRNIFPTIPSIFIGLILTSLGYVISFWSVFTQVMIGQGTPVPVMPTQKLIIEGPYKYSRNPMWLGFGFGLIGLGILFNSISFLLVDLVVFVIGYLYLKLIEEKELALRFGKEYTKYKKSVPFILPKLK